MDDSIQISRINDFIFCPFSLYLHSIYESFNNSLYYDTNQINGKAHHENIDSATYSSAKRYKQGVSIYSEKYGLIGKIDIYDCKEHALIERKYKIQTIFDGYRYQLYAQMFCMEEAGFKVKKLFFTFFS